MNCRDVRHEIALRLGRDGNDPARWQEVREHVAECPECRKHSNRLKSAMNMLEQHANPATTYEVRSSLWSSIEKKLDAPTVRKSPIRQSRLAVLSITAACLFLVAILQNAPIHDRPAELGPGLGRGFFPQPAELFGPHPRAKEAERERREAMQKENG